MSAAMIALQLASVQCLSACTLASCAPAPKDAQLPPCHQHHQAPVANQHDNCDHQKAVNAPSADLALTHLGLAPPVFMPVLMVTAPVAMAGQMVLESPPGLLASSVLRI